MSEFPLHLVLTARTMNKIGLTRIPCLKLTFTEIGSVSSSLFVLTVVVASMYIS